MGGSPCGGNRGHLLAFGLSPASAGLKTVMLLNLGLTPQALCPRLLRRRKLLNLGLMAQALCPRRYAGASF